MEKQCSLQIFKKFLTIVETSCQIPALQRSCSDKKVFSFQDQHL